MKQSAIGGDELHAFGCGLNNGPETLFARAQCFLDLLLLCNVARHFRCANYTALAVSDWRNCKGNKECGTVFARANSLKMVDSLASFDCEVWDYLLDSGVRNRRRS